MTASPVSDLSSPPDPFQPAGTPTSTPWFRLLAAGGLAIAAAVCMRSWGRGLPWALWLPAALLAGTALLMHHRHLGSQLLARAILWSNLLLGVLVSFSGGSGERPIAALLSLCTGGALLLLGRRGLDGDGGRTAFVPVAFRGTLTALMVMALADAQTLLLFGALTLGSPPSSFLSPHTPATLLGLAGVLLVSIAGVYRLRVWGLALGAAGCLGLVGVSLGGALGLPPFLRWAFVATAGLQLLLMVPLGLAMIAGADPSPPRLQRRSLVLSSLLIVLLMLASTVGGTTRMSLPDLPGGARPARCGH